MKTVKDLIPTVKRPAPPAESHDLPENWKSLADITAKALRRAFAAEKEDH